jgi:molecular chaperone HtpG
MTHKITFPTRLQKLLHLHEYESAIRGFADQIGKILSDNKTLFFPDYTDHGIDHINNVLASATELVPEDLWRKRRPGGEISVLPGFLWMPVELTAIGSQRTCSLSGASI